NYSLYLFHFFFDFLLLQFFFRFSFLFFRFWVDYTCLVIFNELINISKEIFVCKDFFVMCVFFKCFSILGYDCFHEFMISIYAIDKLLCMMIFIDIFKRRVLCNILGISLFSVNK